MARVEAALRLALDYNQAINRLDAEALLALVSEDCRFESSDPAPDGRVLTGKQALRRHWESTFKAHTGLRREIEEAVGMGERCLVRWRLVRVSNTGVSDQVRGVDLFKESDGFIKEILSYRKGG